MQLVLDQVLDGYANMLFYSQGNGEIHIDDCPQEIWDHDLDDITELINLYVRPLGIALSMPRETRDGQAFCWWFEEDDK